MRDEVIRISHPVALNVGAVWILRVGPPVIPLREEVVLSARTASALRCGYGYWLRRKEPLCGFEDTRPLDHSQVGPEVDVRWNHHCSKRIPDKFTPSHTIAIGPSTEVTRPSLYLNRSRYVRPGVRATLNVPSSLEGTLTGRPFSLASMRRCPAGGRIR